MKKLRLLGFAAVAALAVLFTMSSCEDLITTFDETLLPGRWQEDTLFEVYNEDGTGYTWDTADDVSESEAQTFSWEIESGYFLIQYHDMESSEATIPKTYTITSLSDTEFAYMDSYGTTHTFVRID
ncbi:MAG: hypothetical protein R3Y59_08740 [bacterium]